MYTMFMHTRHMGYKTMRKIIVGDIHGCYKELNSLMRRVKLDKKEDVIVFLGDYTDRGPDSYKVVRYLMRLKQEMGQRCVLLRGNHEEHILEYVKPSFSILDESFWYYNGGQMTVKSFGDFFPSEEERKEAFERYAAFITANTELYYDLGECFCAHASVKNENPQITLQEDPRFFTWDRSILNGGLYHGKFAVVGHTPMEEPTMFLAGEDGTVTQKTFEVGTEYEIPKSNMLCIDTCCFYTGRLTALVLAEGKMRLYRTFGHPHKHLGRE